MKKKAATFHLSGTKRLTKTITNSQLTITMKRILLFFALLGVFQLTHAEKIHEISLVYEDIDLSNRKFYIDSVMDVRDYKKDIGVVQIGLFNTKYPAQLEGGLESALKTFFIISLPKQNDQIPINIKVKTFVISERTRLADEYAFADITLDYYHGNNLLFSDKQHIEVFGVDVTRMHEKNIRTILAKSIQEFNKSQWQAAIEGKMAEANTKEPLAVVSTTGTTSTGTTSVGATSYTTDQSSSTLQYQNITAPKKNAFTVGYQIGGYSLIGFDYEIRMHDYVGVHFGAGLSGYTYGVMFHTSPGRDSPFFNVCFKDGGFGMLTAAGVEYGGKWVLNQKTGFGLLFQIGLVKILDIKQEFADLLYEDGQAPPFMLSMGFGLSW